jgi:amino acid permease
LTTSGAILGIISTILGGGLVAIPFAFYSIGFSLGMAVIIFAAL